jgi:hypothetical protein
MRQRPSSQAADEKAILVGVRIAEQKSKMSPAAALATMQAFLPASKNPLAGEIYDKVLRICGRRATMTHQFDERLIARAAHRALVTPRVPALRGERTETASRSSRGDP